MAATLTQQELEARLWDAANNLRGPVDPTDFKSYIFPLLFFKWVSDTWDMEHEEAEADFGSEIEADVEADYHRFLIPGGCHWSDLRNTTANVGAKLQKVLDRLQQANPETLAGIFGDVAWANKERIPEASLLGLIDTFDRLTLRPDQVRQRSPRRRLRVPAQAVRRRVRQEGGRVLHPASRRPPPQ